MTYTILKSCFNNTKPRLLNYKDFKLFSQESFKKDLSEALCDCVNSHDDFEHIFTTKLNKMLPKRKTGLGEIISPMLIKPYARPLWKDQGLKIRQIIAKILLTLETIKNNDIMLLT